MNKSDVRFPVVRLFLFLAALYAVLTYCHDFFKTIGSSAFGDFANYYVNTKALLAGYNIWEPSPALTGVFTSIMGGCGITHMCAGILHSSGFFLLICPFTFLPFPSALFWWIILCQAGLWAALALLVRGGDSVGEWSVLPALFLICSFWPLREDIYLAQPNLLVLFFLALALFSLKNGRLYLAGVSLGMALQIKEIFLPLLLFLLIRKYYKPFAVALGVLLLTKLLGIVFFGVEKEIAYWQNIQRYFFLATSRDPFNLSFAAVLARATQGYVHPVLVKTVAFSVTLALLGITWRLFTSAKRSKDVTLEFAYFVTLSLVISPWLHEPHLAVLCMVVPVCWFRLLRDGSGRHGFLFLAGYLLVALKYSLVSMPRFHHGWLSLLATGKTVGLILLLSFLYRVVVDDSALPPQRTP